MRLEIRDIQSSETHIIDESGATIGRQGSAADLPIADRTVSGKHARLLASAGKWLIEDLRSSNGTFVNGERITGPKQLTAGDRFSLCRYGFEVVRIIRTEAAAATAMLRDAAFGSDVSAPGVGDVDPMRGVTSPGQGPLRPGSGQPPRQPTEPFEPALLPSSRSGSVGSSSSFGETLAYVVAALPRAIAYYIAAAPVLLLNPIGAVRRGIAESRFSAMAVRDLVAYALPANLFAAGLGILATVIHTLGWGEITSDLIVKPSITVAIWVVAAIITGWIWHPVLTWLVGLLKGRSDVVSRSNMFVMVHTGIILTGLAGAIGVFVGLVPWTIFGVVPIVVALAANLILVWIMFCWYRHFNVMKWFPLLLLSLGALACVLAVKQIVDVTRGGVAQVKSDGPAEANGSTGGAVAPATRDARIRELRKRMQIAAAEGAGPEELGEMAMELQALQSAPAPVAPEGETDPAGATSSASGTPAARTLSPTAATSTPAAKAPATPPTAEGPATPSTATPTAGVGSTDYEEYLRRRKEVETALDKDPRLLKRKGVESLYKELHKITYRLTKKHKVKMGKRVTAEKIAEQKVAVKKRDAEIFEVTRDIVDRLHRKVVGK